MPEENSTPEANDKPADPAPGASPPPRPRPGADAAPAKPLADYLREDLQPLLQQRMQAEGATDVQITTGDTELSATWDAGDKIFTLYFDEGSLEGRKTITFVRSSSHGRDMQMFMPPERGFKGVDAKQIVTMILIQFTTTLTWIHKTPAAKAAAGKKPKK